MSKIFISVPIINRPELKMMHTMYQTVLTCKEHTSKIFYHENDSLISRVRNVQISKWYNEYPDYEYFVSLDSDIEILNNYPNNNMLTKLIANDVEFVGGLYAVKKPGAKTCSSITLNCTGAQYNTGLIEMAWLSSGCWCLKRSVVTKMIEAYPELTYDGDDTAAGNKVYGLYIPMLYDIKENEFPEVKTPFKKYLSEDWSFNQRWRDIGGKVYADTSIALKHIGKASYSVWDYKIEAVESK